MTVEVIAPHTKSPAASEEREGASAYFALAVFVIAYILSIVDRHILSLLVEPLKRDLGVSDVQIGLLQGLAFSLLYAFVGIPVGLLADRVSRRRIIATGVLVWSVCTALCGFASTFALLFLARMGVGMGEAALSPAAHSSLADAFPPKRLARAMAIFSLGITLGSGAALLIGGRVVHTISASGDTVLPVIGTLRSWQTAFEVVALPGIFVCGLVLLTKEPVRQRAHQSVSIGGLGPLLRYLGSKARVFGGIYGNSTLQAILGGTMTAWYPTLLIRRFGLSVGEAATYLGFVYLIAGSLGSLAGGFLAERFAVRGRADANMRVILILGGIILAPSILAPLMPSPFWMMTMFALLSFAHFGYFGCSVAAIQLATPNEMRATNAALFLLVNSLLGTATGAAIVPLVDRWLFGGEGHLGPALAVVAATTGVFAIVLAAISMKPYGATVVELTGTKT